MDPLLAIPEPAALQAPARWRCIDFISDLHLSPQTPATFSAWQSYMQDTAADAVFILGDLFEVWVGDDARHADWEAQAVRVLRSATARCSVSFMVGNRDFLLGAEMLAECHVQALNDPTLLSAFGHSALLTHGDLLCTDDLDYLRFRAQVRDPAWQAQVLARPLEERRALARHLRSQSEERHAAAGSMPSDVDDSEAARWMAASRTDTLVHGHTHRPASHSMRAGGVRHVLSDWDLDSASSPREQVLRWQSDGWTRLAPAQALRVSGQQRCSSG